MTLSDRFVLGASIVLVVCSYFFFWSGGGALGQRVAVVLRGVEMQVLALKDNQIVEIEGLLGKSSIEVKDGKMRFIASPCQGKQCIHAGWINRSGQIIACLPNGLSLIVEGGKQYDSINF